MVDRLDPDGERGRQLHLAPQCCQHHHQRRASQHSPGQCEPHPQVERLEKRPHVPPCAPDGHHCRDVGHDEWRRVSIAGSVLPHLVDAELGHTNITAPVVETGQRNKPGGVFRKGRRDDSGRRAHLVAEHREQVGKDHGRICDEVDLIVQRKPWRTAARDGGDAQHKLLVGAAEVRRRRRVVFVCLAAHESREPCDDGHRCAAVGACAADELRAGHNNAGQRSFRCFAGRYSVFRL